MKKTYRIYRLENNTMPDVVFKFYLPEEGVDVKTALARKAKRHLELRELKSKGYVITAEMLTDKEGYLNARLKVSVNDYCKLDRDEMNLRMFRHRYTHTTYIKGLECILESKQSAMKRIISLVRRLNNEDLDVQSGVALMLYDQYLKAIM